MIAHPTRLGPRLRQSPTRRLLPLAVLMATVLALAAPAAARAEGSGAVAGAERPAGPEDASSATDLSVAVVDGRLVVDGGDVVEGESAVVGGEVATGRRVVDDAVVEGAPHTDPGDPEGVGPLLDDLEGVWDTAGVAPGEVRGDVVHLDLVAHEGPGEVVAIEPSPDARVTLLGSAPGAPRSMALAVGAPQRHRWAVAEPGGHRLVLEVQAELVDGPAVVRVVQELTVADERLDPGTVVTPGQPEPEVGAPTTTLAPEPSGPPEPSAPAGPALAAPPVETGGVPKVVEPGPEAVPEAAGVAAVAQSGEQLVIADGHVDVGAHLVDGAMEIDVKDDTAPGGPVDRDPASLVLHAAPASRTEVPAGPAFSFLGAPGSPTWILPQVQQPGLLWPGWNTQRILPGEIVGETSWSLLGVDGPGRFALFVTNQFGTPTVLFDDGAPLPQTMAVPIGTHAHGSWAFSAEGVYRVQLEVSAGLPGGGTASGQATLTFTVGDTPPPPPGPGPAPAPDPGGDSPGGDDAPGGAPPGSGSGSGSGPEAGAGGTSSSGGAGSSGATGSGAGVTTMPRTGAESAGLARAGAATALVGALLVVLARRRRS